MTKDEALRMALEALEVATTPLAKDRQEVLRAQAAIREVLAQPEREPLTDEEIYSMCRNEGDEHSTCFIFNKDGTWSVLTLARAIEAAHGITGENK